MRKGSGEMAQPPHPDEAAGREDVEKHNTALLAPRGAKEEGYEPGVVPGRRRRFVREGRGVRFRREGAREGRAARERERRVPLVLSPRRGRLQLRRPMVKTGPARSTEGCCAGGGRGGRGAREGGAAQARQREGNVSL